MKVTEEQDGSFTIDWDPNDPVESVFNTWTEEDFIQCIKDHAREVLGEETYNAILSGQTDQQYQEELPEDLPTEQQHVHLSYDTIQVP